ncbi:MAG TPA: glycerol-3-phosphate 1-O-acyltransferase PlsY, partial [Burkholderiales bacterium]|nr:glycerol-3-phosphate 1-O-acyltransferase PlsY [Burkholderiales bacterium]
MLTIVIVMGAYLLGSVSFAVLTSQLFHLPDPRSYGSKNPGATNVLRTGKKAAAALTLLGDTAKGWLAVWLAKSIAPQYGLSQEVIVAAALAVFLGHLYSIFLRFQGGKGVSTALGVLLALDVWLGLATLATWIMVFVISRISSLSALTAAALMPLYSLYVFGLSNITLAVLSISLLLIWRHKSNIKNLIAGTESDFKKSGQRRLLQAAV